MSVTLYVQDVQRVQGCKSTEEYKDIKKCKDTFIFRYIYTQFSANTVSPSADSSRMYFIVSILMQIAAKMSNILCSNLKCEQILQIELLID